MPAAARPDLAAARARVAAPAERRVGDASEDFDASGACLTGLPPQAVRPTLDGRLPRLPLKDQVHRRFERPCSPRPNVQAHSPAVLWAHDVRSIATRGGRLLPAGGQSPADHLDELPAREGRLGRPGTGHTGPGRAGPCRTVRGRGQAAEGGAP